MGSKIRDTQIGRMHVHTIAKQDFYWGHNYLSSLYSLYAMKPETIILILAIIDTISELETCSITDIYKAINDHPHILSAYQDFLAEKYQHTNKSLPDIIEKQMISRLIKRLVTIGIIDEISEQNTYIYRLMTSGIENLTAQQLELLSRAIFVYKNISLFSTAGNTLLKKVQPLHTNTSLLDELEQPTTQAYESQYLFTYNNPLHVIDESLLYTIAQALQDDRMLELSFYNKRRPKVLVQPVKIESDYIGNRDYLIAYHKQKLVTYRIDSIDTIITKGAFTRANQIPQKGTKYKTTLHVRFYKLSHYVPMWDDFNDILRHVTMIVEQDTSQYIDVELQVQDGQILLPVLRTFLPYIKILHSIPESIRTRFNDNLHHTQHEIVSEPSSYTKKIHPTWNLLSPEPTDPDNSAVSPLLNEMTAITCSTQYRIQQDLINGISYTLDDLQYIINHRPLLDSYAPVEENDQYEQTLPSYLVTSSAQGLQPLFPHLPALVLTTAERMFLKDLLTDCRINWMLPVDIQKSLNQTLAEVPTTLPANTWTNKSLAIDRTADSYTNHWLCTQAMIEQTTLSWETTKGVITIIPCKLEYNTATNGFSLIGYHAADETFHYYSLDTLPIVTVGEVPVEIDTNALYKEYQETNRQTVVFTIYDLNNAIDRCFNAFSNYEIVGSETEPNTFTLSVEYLPFQKKDIVRILLSLGAAIRVHNPRTLKEQLNTIYVKTILLLDD
ncbi:WYL domain-containing protein [Veillonella sp. ZSJB6]|uniref:WYL domain-containing protein n=1 Tax=Veillonella sp. ZSJB6 TaxID=3451359 RepID=UPI003EE541AF